MNLINLIVGLLFMVIGYLIMPRPKRPKREIQEMDAPTAQAGRTIPLLLGHKRIKDPNFLWYGDKAYVDRMDNSGGAKKSKGGGGGR